VADCPDLYPYELVVEWLVNDRFFSPGPVEQLAGAIREVLPDVEVWQRSVVRPDETRAKFRFRTVGERTIGASALASVDPSVFLTRIVEQNPPDQATRGIP
jgi:hypothetical protein